MRHLLLPLVLLSAHAQPVPLPSTTDGLVQGSATAQVTVELWADLLCPDCAASWPVMQVGTAVDCDGLLRGALLVTGGGRAQTASHLT